MLMGIVRPDGTVQSLTGLGDVLRESAVRCYVAGFLHGVNENSALIQCMNEEDVLLKDEDQDQDQDQDQQAEAEQTELDLRDEAIKNLFGENLDDITTVKITTTVNMLAGSQQLLLARVFDCQVAAIGKTIVVYITKKNKQEKNQK